MSGEAGAAGPDAPAGHILVVNAGSSSLKFALFGREGEERQLAGAIDFGTGPPRLSASGPLADRLQGRAPPPAGDMAAAVAFLLEALGVADGQTPLCAAGHRIVHGGAEFDAPVRLGPDTLDRLDALVPLAPAHQPQNLAAVRALFAFCPGLLQVGCFDTAFHRTMPALARRFPIPRALHGEGLERYGFHGLSYAHLADVLPGLVGAAAARGRVVAAHLGSGASLCAMHGLSSVATTMGLTALDGLMMGTRCGSIDPGLVLHLLRRPGASAESVEALLGRESGLLGVSGLSADLRVLEASDAPEAEEALALFALVAARGIAALTADLGGLDVLAFTGGIGANGPAMRARIAARLEHLGVVLDPDANAAGGPRIEAPGAPVAVAVVPADEEAVIARATAAVLAGQEGSAPGAP